MEYTLWTQKLKALRKNKGLRQQDIADKVTFSRSQYCAIENGDCIANYIHLYQLAKAFKMPLDEFIAMRNITVMK